MKKDMMLTQTVTMQKDMKIMTRKRKVNMRMKHKWLPSCKGYRMLGMKLQRAAKDISQTTG